MVIEFPSNFCKGLPLKVTVKLRDGQLFTRCDFTPQLVNENLRTISFWDNKGIRTYSLDLIEYFIVFLEE